MRDLDTKTFEEAIQADSPVVVDFWAPWCMPCRAFAPVLEELADELDGTAEFCKLNIDDHSELSVRYGVETIPTVIIFKKGEVMEQFSGRRPKEEVQALVEKHA